MINSVVSPILKEKVFKIWRPLLNSLSKILKQHKGVNLIDIVSLNMIIAYNYRYKTCLNKQIQENFIELKLIIY